MNSLNILSGGAAQGLVTGLASMFKTRTGLEISGEFGAVGAMAEKLRQGTQADLVILTAAIVAKLAQDGLVVPASITDVGLVETALAVRTTDPQVAIQDSASLREALLASDAIYVPDIKASTAGIHVARILAQLGVTEDVADRLRIYPNGATAMRELAHSNARRPIGCTQSTEIISTGGVVLSGSLPPGCELATTYTAGITKRSVQPSQAQRLIDLLIAPEHHDVRERAGFLNAP